MKEQNQSLQDIQQIKQMMERSSRFISLSGFSGVAAGVCALVGAWFASNVIAENGAHTGYRFFVEQYVSVNSFTDVLSSRLMQIALLTFIAAAILAFVFTYIRTKKANGNLWTPTTQRLFLNVTIPILAGGIYLFRQMQLGHYSLIAPGCLVFYGLALVNASKYTLGDIRYLGYCQIILGMLNCWYVGYGLQFWAIGFGVLHIIYGIVMWYKYERKN